MKKQLNDSIAILRSTYDRLELTAKELLEYASSGSDDNTQLILDDLSKITGNKDHELNTRVTAALAQFGIIRLLLNEAELEFAELAEVDE